jgi:hypothetical protein
MDGRSTAARLIKGVLAEGGTSLAKMLTNHGGRLRKPARRDLLPISLERKLAKAGITIRDSAGFEKVDDTYAANGVRGDSVEVIAKILGRGSGHLNKATGLPPQSVNATWDDNRAEDGADRAHDAVEAERQSAGVRPKPTSFTAPHSASIRGMNALPTQDGSGGDATLTAIKAAQRQPKALVPGALRGDTQDPNRDDASR